MSILDIGVALIKVKHDQCKLITKGMKKRKAVLILKSWLDTISEPWCSAVETIMNQEENKITLQSCLNTNKILVFSKPEKMTK